MSSTDVLEAELFREVADQLPIFLWRISAELDRDWVNRAWIDFTGVPLDEQRGFFWLSLLHPDDAEQVASTFARAFERKERVTSTFRLRRHDGSYRWVVDTGVPVYKQGEFAGFAGSCVEIAGELAAASFHGKEVVTRAAEIAPAQPA
jgi:two-component system, sensor histidine kinase PdtaS